MSETTNCPHCGAEDALTPADHPCLDRLKRQLKALTTSYTHSISTTVDFNKFPRVRLMEIEQELLDLYERMRTVTQWYSEELEKARLAREKSHRVQSDGRKWVNAAREALRDQIKDVD